MKTSTVIWIAFAVGVGVIAIRDLNKPPPVTYESHYDPGREERLSPVQTVEPTPRPTVREKPKFGETEVCRAAIAAIMNRPLSIVGIERIAPDGVVFLSYVRPDDQSRWAFKCYTDYPEVIWGKSDGRWRVHIDDPKIMFSVSGEVLTIMEDFGDGSSSIDTYDLSDF